MEHPLRAELPQPLLSPSGRTIESDKRVKTDCRKQKFVNYLFLRLIAKKKVFTEVDFRYSIFEACYLRDCTFDSCNFTGCRFVSIRIDAMHRDTGAHDDRSRKTFFDTICDAIAVPRHGD